MQVRFWGVRGSVPWATRESIGYGCNTPCVEVRNRRSGELLVLDAGSGIVGLGQALGDDVPPVSILLSHYHWDHLQGLPFFPPLVQPGRSTMIYAPVLADAAAAAVQAVFERPHYPLPMAQLPSPPSVQLVEQPDAQIAGFTVRSRALNHPGGSVAYRIAGRTGQLVYATDHEFGDAVVDEGLVRLCAGASVLVLDAHFTPSELPAAAGWGHGSWQQCAELAARAGAGELRLFHHKPGRTDAELDAIVRQARAIFPATRAAREGDTFSL